ncbi:MAG: SulP family inorganic anion transporter [Lachnospiraceae bacterium]|nr:SulP family inorganic anion transporter [Lachnospiraceae bacterium]
MIPKLFCVMRGYTAKRLSKDVVSGIIVAIIALPLSIALALASGVAPEQGIYTAIIAGFIISFLGGSRVQISGPTAAFAGIVGGIVAKRGMDGLVVATIIAGGLLIVMGLLRLGNLIKFIPFTITVGFTAGIAVSIVIGQLKDFLGLTYTADVRPLEAVEKLKAVVRFIATIRWQAVVVGLICLTILIIWPKINQVVPASLIAVLVGVTLVKGLDLEVNTIGDLYTIKGGLPSFRLPGLSWNMLSDSFNDGMTIAVLAAIESLLSCVVADSMVNSTHFSNMELIAQGVGNIGSVLFGGIPATGAIARTAANIKSGGRTPIAGMVHSVVLLLVLLVLMPYAALIPMPTIAAILFMVAYNMSGWRTFIKILRSAPKSDVAVLLATFALTVIFDLVVAIEVGMLVALVLFMKRMSSEATVQGWTYFDPQQDSESIDLRVVPEYIRVYEIEGPLFFGSVEAIGQISLRSFTKVLILRMRSVPAIDMTALQALEELIESCAKEGVQVIFSHVNEQPMKVLEKSGIVDIIGCDHFCGHIDEALARAEQIGGAKRNKK